MPRLQQSLVDQLLKGKPDGAPRRVVLVGEVLLSGQFGEPAGPVPLKRQTAVGQPVPQVIGDELVLGGCHVSSTCTYQLITC